jgi:hypothetical protein
VFKAFGKTCFGFNAMWNFDIDKVALRVVCCILFMIDVDGNEARTKNIANRS